MMSLTISARLVEVISSHVYLEATTGTCERVYCRTTPASTTLIGAPPQSR